MAQQPPQQMLKYSVHHFRAPGVDEQAFNKWYQEEQVPRMIKIIQKHGIDHYKLYVTPASLRQVFQADLDKMKPNQPGWKMADFDVTSLYWVADPQSLRNLLTDPDWEGKVVEFEKGWIDSERAEIQIGWETTYLEDNKIANTATKEYE